MSEEIVNRVAKSPIITLNLEEYYHQGERIELDVADQLYQGLILREKDFREFVKTHDWTAYEGKNVVVHCSADAIVPTWAYMLIASKLEPIANMVVFGSHQVLEFALFQKSFEKIDWKEFVGRPVVVKGCGDLPISESIYVEVTRLLTPYAKSIMYGEPCSTVPIFKKPKVAKN